MRKFKFLKEEIFRICELQKIEFEDYEFFSTFIERGTYYNASSEEKSIKNYFKKEYEMEKLPTGFKDYLDFYKFKYKNNIYLIKKTLKNEDMPRLIIPE